MITLKHVTMEYPYVRAVDDLSFELRNGEILGLVGQNGAGKSTTFKLILNFIKPTNGEILFDGKPFDETILQSLGYLPEERGLYLDMTIEQHVKYFADLHGYPRKKFAAALPEWLERLQVKGTAKTKIRNLSKGNQQKVQLICTLIHEPKLVILDEPFSGLDPVNSEILLGVVKTLKKQGTAVIFSSHNMHNVEHIADKVLMLVNGQRQLYGSIAAIKQQFASTQVYVEPPFLPEQHRQLPGLITKTTDYPGEVLTFASHAAAKQAYTLAKERATTTGLRLLPPTLDAIFKLTLREKNNETN